MLRFRIYKNQIAGNKGEGLYYGKLTHETMTFDEFIQHLAGHNASFTEGTFYAVLTDTMNCLRELLLLGKAVRLGDMGIFSLGAVTEGSETAKDIDKEHRTGFHVANIKGLRVNWYLGKKFNAKQLFNDATFKEAGKYSIDEGDGDNGGGSADVKGDEGDQKTDKPSQGDSGAGDTEEYGSGSGSDGGGSTDGGSSTDVPKEFD